MFGWLKKKKIKYEKRQQKYEITCGKCGYIRLGYEAPSGGVTCNFNSTSFCPKCGFCGGGVRYLDDNKEVKQLDEKEKKRWTKSFMKNKVEMDKEFMKGFGK